MRRKPNPDQRRRALCDAAIRLLAEDGVKGVSHLKVDRRAGVPDGTTSFYFRTRAALLHAVAERVSELDLKDLTAATRQAEDPAAPSGLATLVVQSSSGARLVRTKARIELALQATRDPQLQRIVDGYLQRFFELIRDAVRQIATAEMVSDTRLIDEQAYVLMTLISGIMFGYASGHQRSWTAAELDQAIVAVVRGINRVPALAD